MVIIPTIFEKEFQKAEERFLSLINISSWIQVDVLDNLFALGKTFKLELINSFVGQERYLWDIHLMVKEPILWLEKCLSVGASRVIGQVEMMTSKENFIGKIKNEGLEAGLAFDIETKITTLPSETDLVLLMGRPAGFGTPRLDRRVFEKIKAVKDLGLKVAVDGGVTTDNLDELEKTQVDFVYCGSQFMQIYAGKNKQEN